MECWSVALHPVAQGPPLGACGRDRDRRVSGTGTRCSSSTRRTNSPPRCSTSCVASVTLRGAGSRSPMTIRYGRCSSARGAAMSVASRFACRLAGARRSRARAGEGDSRPWVDIQCPIDDIGDLMRRRVEHILVGGSAGCHGQRGHLARSTVRASRLGDVAPDFAQHLAYVAEPIPGLAEQLRCLADAHRGVVRHSGDREFEFTDLIGDDAERLEVDLAPCGSGGIGGGRPRISDWFG